MSNLRRILAPVLLVILLFWAGTVAAAEITAADVKVDAHWEIRHVKPPTEVITLELTNADDEPFVVPFKRTPAAADASSYELKVKVGTLEETVPVTPEFVGTEASHPDRAGSIRLNLNNHVLSVDKVYTLHIAKGAIEAVPEVAGEPSNQQDLTPIPLDEQNLALDNRELDSDLAFQTGRAVENKLEVDGGSGGGVGQFRLDYGINRFARQDWLYLQFRGTGDFNFQAAQRNQYFNSLTGEVRFAHVFLWDMFSLLKQGRYVELDAHGRVESDQTFDNADALGGARLSAYTKDPITGFLSTLFVPNDPATNLPTEAVVTPLVTLSCDYVSQVADQPNAPGGASKPDTAGGDARLQAGFYWSMPLARSFTVQGTNVPPLLGAVGSLVSGPFGGQAPDIDALFELHGVYDSAQDEFLDQSQISLAFSGPREAGKARPSVALTWARGKAAPTFNEISALLVGLRVAF